MPEKGVRKDERDGDREKPEKLQCGTLHHKIFGFSVYDLIEDATLMHESKPSKAFRLCSSSWWLNSKLEHVLIKTQHYTQDYMHRSLLLRSRSRAGERY